MKGPPMTKRILLASALACALLCGALGQQPTTTTAPTPPPATPTRDEDDEVVRITTNLVQVDAVVTDRSGRQVTDLRAEDFEVLENGRPQQITNFSYINAGPAPVPPTAAAPVVAAAPDRNAPPVPPARLRASQVRRTIALVVDDLMMSAESIREARHALKRYVDEQVQPGDLVAVIRTRGGVGTLQQFTNDRQQLYAAIERIRWTPGLGGGQSSVAPINTLSQVMESQGSLGGTRSQLGDLPEVPDASRASIKELNEYRQELFTVGTLGSLNFVVRGLRGLPGRKAVILFSDGLTLQDSHGESRVYANLLQHLIDLANRASVVFYAIDARGLQPLGPFASDDTAGSPRAPGSSGAPLNGIGGIRPDQIGQQVLGRRAGEIFEGQSGLSLLAQATGGTALFNANDLNLGIRRALDDMRGYYLIGYRPDEASFDAATGRRRFNRLTVRVKNRPELRVRSRSGYVGLAEELGRATAHTRSEQLMDALISPFAAAGLNLRLTSLFINSAAEGSVVRSLLLIDPRTLTFARQPDGQYQTVMDILAITFDGDGRVVDQLNRIETIRVRPENFRRFQIDGMVYDLNVPVKKPGAYQLRIAVRDAASERVGAAGQFVQVPNLGTGRLTLSGLLLAAAATVPGSVAPVAGDGADAASDALSGTAARRFRRGTMLDYGFVIYNARLNGGLRRPRLVVQARLFREGQQIFVGQAQPLNADGQPDLTRLQAGGRLQLSAQLPPGEYVLQIVVADENATGARAAASQWIDFELTD